jgi:arylsulfatase A-like enzyme
MERGGMSRSHLPSCLGFGARFSFALGLSLAALAGCRETGSGQEAAAARPARRPNVLLIVLDTTRRDRLSAYGHDKPTSPAFDRIAAEGTLYENCITAGSWTVPSHASLFTGLFPRDHGADVDHLELAEEHVTLAELLRQAGYQTGGICCNPWIGPRNGFVQGFDTYDEVWRPARTDTRDAHGAALTTERALTWIDARPKDGPPWFLFLNYLEPHTPYRPPAAFRNRFLPPDADPSAVERVMRWQTPHEFGYMLKVPGYEISAEEFEVMHGLYDGDVAYQDARLGELLDGLRQRGVLDDTLLAIVADHGEQLGEHGMLDHKMTVYEENIRVPLVLRYPGAIPAGARLEATVQSLDLFPTILQLAQVPYGTPRGAAPLPLSDEAGPGRVYTFADFGRPTDLLKMIPPDWPDVSAWDRSIKTIRGPRFKYIHYSNGARELYDLAQDPHERYNVVEQHPDVRAQLEELLLAFHDGRDDMIWPAVMEPDRVEALRSLGYVD